MSEPLATTLEGLPSAETGTPPSLRFINSTNKSDGEPLHSRFEDLRVSGDIRSFEIEHIEGMMNYWPPYSAEQLTALNLQNQPNSSCGELPKRVNQKVALWSDFTSGNSGLWRVSFINAPPEFKEELEDQASECLNLTWTEQPESTVLTIKSFKEHSLYGFGPVLWADCYSPMPCAKKGWEPRFPPRTEIGFSNLTEFGLKDKITLLELYEASKRDKALGGNGKASGGWEHDEIVKLLKLAATKTGGWFDYTSMDDVFSAEMNGSGIFGKGRLSGSSEVEVIRMFVKEYFEDDDGFAISFYTIADISGWRIIQRRERHYLDWSSVITAAIDDTGLDGTISGLRGLGLDIRATCRDIDILHCSRNWAANHRMTPIYQTPTGSAAEIAERLVIRPNSIMMGQGIVELESQVDWSAGEGVLLALNRELDSIQGIYQINNPTHKGTQRTAEESRQDALKEQDTRLSQILPMSKLYIVPLGREFARRLISYPKSEDGEILKFAGWKVAKSFWDKVAQYPRLQEMLPGLVLGAQISINPNATPDGLDKRLMKYNLLMDRLPLYNTQAQRNRIINNYTSAVLGHTAAIPYFNEDEKPMDTNLAAFIDSENADMIAGSPRVVFPDQDHFLHLGTLEANGQGHCAAIVREMEEIQQGLQEQFQVDAAQDTADRLYSGLAFLAHCDAHIMLAAQNPALMDGDQIQAYFDFSAQLKQLLKTTLALFQKEMEKRAAEDGSQVDPKVAAIMAKTEAEIASMTAKTDAQIKLDEVRMLNKLGNQNQVAEARTQQRQVDYTLQTAMKQQQLKMDLAIKSIDAGTRAVQERADAQRDLAKAEKEKEKAAASKPASTS